MDAQTLLAEANACHDDDPARGAELLRRIAPAGLDAGQRPLYGFLLNHVLGELCGDWTEANKRVTALLALPDPAPAVLRHAAVAATLAGDASAEERTQALAAAAGVGLPQSAELVALAAAALRLSKLAAADAGALVQAVLAPLEAPHWAQASSLDQPAAAQCSNIGSELADRPVDQLSEPSLRTAMTQAALASQRLWQRIGTWVQHERAHYLCALVASAQGDAAQAWAQAQAGLALIDAHDAAREQEIDRAFLSLEAAFALQRLGRDDEARALQASADALAAAFGDAGLDAWYRQRLARNRALAG